MVGLGALFALGAMELLRGVDRIETVALALFVVIAVTSAIGLGWGMAAAVGATVAYALLRRNALDVSGSDAVNRMILARAVGFVSFGVLFGISTRALRPLLLAQTRVRSVPPTSTSLIVDPLAALDREVARARRHRRPLTAIMIDLTIADHDGGLPQTLRSSDLVLRRAVGNESALTIILPETDSKGAHELADRFPSSESARIISLVSDDGTAHALDVELEDLRRRVAGSASTPAT